MPIEPQRRNRRRGRGKLRGALRRLKERQAAKGTRELPKVKSHARPKKQVKPVQPGEVPLYKRPAVYIALGLVVGGAFLIVRK